MCVRGTTPGPPGLEVLKGHCSPSGLKPRSAKIMRGASMGEWFLSRRWQNVPEGRCDRSLARSAWKSATQKSRPVGYGVMGAGGCTDSIIWVTKFEYQTETIYV